MKLRVVVLGAGFGGLELSTILSEKLGDRLDLTLIDKNESFFFGFSKFDLIFGHKKSDAIHLRYKNIVKPGVKFIQDTITSIDPVTKIVTTQNGTYEADVLVIALGADYDIAATPGLEEGGNEFYSLAGAERLRDKLPAFTRGKVIIGVCSAPFKCPPAPSEMALLMHDYLTKRRIRNECEISIVMPFGLPIPPSPDTSKALLTAFAERNISFIPKQKVKEIDTSRHVAILEDGKEMPFDLFLGIPKHRVPDVVRQSGMTVNGWIPVDKTNLKTQYKNVYAIGDVNSVGTPKAGVFAEGAAKVAAASILVEFEGGEQPSPYKGDGICYVEFGRGMVGKVNVDFFSGPSPFGSYTEASADLVIDKKHFGASRGARWFGIETISVEELNHSNDNVFLIDLMSKEEFASNHISGAINIPIEELKDRITEIPKDKEVVVACRRGLMKSDMALQQLHQSGITNPKKLDGGTAAWLDFKLSAGQY
jgi:sulfide:quinone oxidoreductase